MSKTPRDEPHNSHLLGAYFDGELAGEACAAEREAIARRLTVDEEARALIEDFSELRDALRELPRHSLPADFAQQVLRRAERAMLLDSAEFDAADCRDAAAFSRNGHAAKPWDLLAAAAGNNQSSAKAVETAAETSPAVKLAPATYFAPPAAATSHGNGAGRLALAAALLLIGFGWMNWRDDQAQPRASGTAENARVAALDDVAAAERLVDGGAAVEGPLEGRQAGAAVLFSEQADSGIDAKAPALAYRYGQPEAADEVADAADGLLVVCDIAAQPADAYVALEEAFTNHRIDVVPSIQLSAAALGDGRSSDPAKGGGDANGVATTATAPSDYAPSDYAPSDYAPSTRADAPEAYFAKSLPGQSSATEAASEVRAYLVDATPLQLQNALLDMSTLPAATISVGRMNLAESRDRRLLRANPEEYGVEVQRLGEHDPEESGVEMLGLKQQAKGAKQSPSKESWAKDDFDALADENSNQRNQDRNDPSRAKDQTWVGFARPLRLSPQQLADGLSLERERFGAAKSYESQQHAGALPGQPQSAAGGGRAADRPTGEGGQALGRNRWSFGGNGRRDPAQHEDLSTNESGHKPASPKRSEGKLDRQDQLEAKAQLAERGASAGRDTAARESELLKPAAAPAPARALFVFRVSPPAAAKAASGGGPATALPAAGLPAAPAKE